MIRWPDRSMARLLDPFPAEPFHSGAQAVFELHLGAPAQFAARFFSRDFSPAKVAGSPRNKVDAHVVSDVCANPLGDVEHGDFAGAFQVVGLVDRRGCHGEYMGLSQISDIDEIEVLAFIDGNREGLPEKRHSYEDRNEELLSHA